MPTPLDSRDLAVLPVDELGIWLLRTLQADKNHMFSRAPALMQILKSVGQKMPSDRVYKEALNEDGVPHLARALAESWDWLVSGGMLAQVMAGMVALQLPLEGYYFITRFGERVATHERPREWLSAERRLGLTLHPRLEERARRQFVMGEFEAAALLSMREVEIAVRELSGFPDTVVGTDLMNRAFGADGPLSDDDAPDAEQQGRQSLYRAAMAVFKNPASHRHVELTDPTQAAEVVLFADLLLRMLPQSSEHS
jgi:uncharacterized protein (TIGR02391 family)